MTSRRMFLVQTATFGAGLAALPLAGSLAFAASDTATRSEIVTLGATKIEVLVNGAGPLVVILPSSARGLEDFEDTAKAFAAQGFRVLRPQPRLVGASTGPTEGITLRDLAADVAGVITHYNQGPAVLVGHAFGNWVARMTATAFPDKVRGVVVAAAAAKHIPPELLAALRTAGDVKAQREDRLKALSIAFFAPGNDPAVWLEGWYPQLASYQRPIIAAPKTEEWWQAGKAPVLDLQATLDPFRPRETANSLRDELGERVTVAFVEGASHALFPERPEATAKAIVAWIKALPPVR